MERDGHVYHDELEAVMEYIDLKLTQKFSRQDLSKRLQSKAQLQFCIKSALNETRNQEVIQGRHKH